jgi:hypothetical protein
MCELGGARIARKGIYIDIDLSFHKKTLKKHKICLIMMF